MSDKSIAEQIDTTVEAMNGLAGAIEKYPYSEKMKRDVIKRMYQLADELNELKGKLE